MGRKNLNGYRAFQPRIARPVHLSHPTRTERPNNFITWSKGHKWRDYSPGTRFVLVSGVRLSWHVEKPKCPQTTESVEKSSSSPDNDSLRDTFSP